MKTNILLISLFILGCKSNDPKPDLTEIAPGETEQKNWFVPVPDVTFDWQLSTISDDDQFVTDVVDIDAFDASAELVERLHSEGRKVIGYISVGTIEDWRPDANDYPTSIVGNSYDGWDGEKWVDIRNLDVLGPLLEARLNMVKAKGFDGVEPDNMDEYEYPDPGFSISKSDQIAFCKWFAASAHDRGLSIGQKNATELVPDLIDDFDWILLEDAFVDDFYADAIPYIVNGKAVFAAEYLDNMTSSEFLGQACPVYQAKHFSAILKDRDLGKGLVSCD